MSLKSNAAVRLFILIYTAADPRNFICVSVGLFSGLMALIVLTILS